MINQEPETNITLTIDLGAAFGIQEVVVSYSYLEYFPAEEHYPEQPSEFTLHGITSYYNNHKVPVNLYLLLSDDAVDSLVNQLWAALDADSHYDQLVHQTLTLA